MTGRCALAAVLSLFTIVGVATDSRAAEGYFIGDSIGQGIAQMTGLPGLAKPSVNLRRSEIADQLRRAPKGSVVLMSLGLNDAVDPVPALTPYIEKVIAAAEATGARVVWVGPPCVLKAWDEKAARLDEHLRTRLLASTIQYVSLRDADICQPAIRARDGEHFTPGGYRYVWEKIQRASSFASEVQIPAPRTPGRVMAAALPGVRAGATATLSKALTLKGFASDAKLDGLGTSAIAPRRDEGARAAVSVAP